MLRRNPSLRAATRMATFALSFATMAESDVIARIGDVRITARDVSCSRELASANPKWLNGRTVDEACLDAKRDKFRRLATRELLERAATVEEFEPTQDQLAPFHVNILRDEAQLQRLVDLGLQIPRAVARVYRGESLEHVYEDAIRRTGASLDSFRREVKMYRSLEVVERHLAKDHVQLARRQFEQHARQSALRAEFRKRIAASADAQNETIEVAADRFLQSVIARIGVEVLDPQFQLPSGREIFL